MAGTLWSWRKVIALVGLGLITYTLVSSDDYEAFVIWNLCSSIDQDAVAMYGRIFTLYRSHPTQTGRENTLPNQRSSDIWLAFLESTIWRETSASIPPLKGALLTRLQVSGQQRSDREMTIRCRLYVLVSSSPLLVNLTCRSIQRYRE